jgi:excinuclease ABC subunit A
VTGAYLSGKKAIAVPKHRRSAQKRALVIRGARTHNLRDLTVSFPLGVITCVTGVSGSGKSSLIVDTLLPALKHRLHGARAPSAEFHTVEGLQHVDKVIDVDQSPIGRTPRSNPATFTGIFTHIRDLFAGLPESKARGCKPGRYSFNVKGGRCEACQGDGIVRMEMHFLPDVYVKCEACGGRRYSRETLEVKYRQASIADVLDMTVSQVCGFLENIPKLRPKLETLREVGLGYVTLGQAATTLSGGAPCDRVVAAPFKNSLAPQIGPHGCGPQQLHHSPAGGLCYHRAKCFLLSVEPGGSASHSAASGAARSCRARRPCQRRRWGPIRRRWPNAGSPPARPIRW